MTLHARFHRSLSSIDEAAWAALDSGGQVFLDYRFLLALEAHGAASPELGWSPRHLTLEDSNGKILGALPLYLRHHSFGDFSQDWQWPGAWQQAGLDYYPKLVSGIPFTPASGPRLLVHPEADRAAVLTQLLQAAIGLAEQAGCSVWQCLFIEERDRQFLQQAGLLLRHGNQFHWQNRAYRDFEHFLDGFSADKRKKVKRERRRVAEAGIVIEARHGGDIAADEWPSIHRHYRATFERYGNHPALSEAFFCQLGAALDAERGLVVFLARLHGRIVASAICYRDQQALYGRHWGADGDFDSLHFELCYYQGIEYCIRHGLSRFEPGAHGEHKISRGFAPTATCAAYWIADARMRQGIAAYLQREQAQVEHYQDELATHLPYKTRTTGDEHGL